MLSKLHQSTIFHFYIVSLYQPLNRVQAFSHSFKLFQHFEFISALGINTLSTLRSLNKAFLSFQTPEFSPARNPAPKTLNSELSLRSTWSFVKSASSWHTKSLRDTPPSTLKCKRKNVKDVIFSSLMRTQVFKTLIPDPPHFDFSYWKIFTFSWGIGSDW